MGYGGTGGTSQATARSGLGLGSISTQDAGNVAITGGTINGTTIGITSPMNINTTSVTLVGSTSPITLDTDPGTAGYIMTSGGAGVTPSWESTATLLLTAWASPGTIGSTTPNTGVFTTLTAGTITNPIATVPLTVNSQTGQTADLQDWQVTGRPSRGLILRAFTTGTLPGT